MFQIDRKLQFALVLPVLLCSSCAISLGIGVGEEEHHWEEHEDEWDEEHHDDRGDFSEGRELEDLERGELELLMAEISAESELLSGDGRIGEAELSLEIAHEELRGFEEWGAPDQIREAELDVERAELELEEGRETLAQLESDYARFADDELASKTAEIVLGRHRAKVRFSEAELELARRQLEHLVEVQLPNERRSLMSAVQSAEVELRVAEMDLEAASLSAELSIRDAQEALEEEECEEEEGHVDEEEEGEGHSSLESIEPLLVSNQVELDLFFDGPEVASDFFASSGATGSWWFDHGCVLPLPEMRDGGVDWVTYTPDVVYGFPSPWDCVLPLPVFLTTDSPLDETESPDQSEVQVASLTDVTAGTVLRFDPVLFADYYGCQPAKYAEYGGVR